MSSNDDELEELLDDAANKIGLGLERSAIARDLARLAAGQRPPDFYVVAPRGDNVWTVGPLLGERARITRASEDEHELGLWADGWDYDSVLAAFDAFFACVVEGDDGVEPEGWVRHMPSGRRRPAPNVDDEQAKVERVAGELADASGYPVEPCEEAVRSVLNAYRIEADSRADDELDRCRHGFTAGEDCPSPLCFGPEWQRR